MTELTPSERAPAADARRPGSGGACRRRCSSSAGADEHAVEAAVARLRAKLGPLGAGIRTVRRRGYASTLSCRKLTDAARAE